MSTGTLAKVAARTAKEVCQRFELGEEAKKLLRDNQTPKALLDQLTEKKLFTDAARLLAYALPKQEAVWWACLCARQAHGANPPPKVAAALQAAEKWAADPSEDNRRLTLAAAQAAELGTPAGCAAVSAFWSGGSLAPPNVPVVPPKEHLTAHGVVCAVMLAAVLTEPQKSEEKYKKFLALGVEVANGTNRWKPAAPQAAAGVRR
jgi:hypothetical protein